jgi:hypothetical protein
MASADSNAARWLQARRLRVEASWQRVQPALRELQGACGRTASIASTQFTPRDWEWASGTYLARMIALPIDEGDEDAVVKSLVPGVLTLCMRGVSRYSLLRGVTSRLEPSAVQRDRYTVLIAPACVQYTERG